MADEVVGSPLLLLHPLDQFTYVPAKGISLGKEQCQFFHFMPPRLALPSPIGHKEREPEVFFPLPTLLMADEECGQIAHIHLQGHITCNQVSSTVLLRQGTGPCLLSVAVKER